MFKPNRRYRHRNCLDVDFFIQRILGETETYISVIVSAWHRSMKGHITRPFVAEIKHADVDNWQEMTDE